MFGKLLSDNSYYNINKESVKKIEYIHRKRRA